MAKYPEHKQLNLPAVADELLQYWQDKSIFERSVTEREGKPSYTFYEGPPSANGLPGIHHVMARSIKDLAVIRSIGEVGNLGNESVVTLQGPENLAVDIAEAEKVSLSIVGVAVK